jgi:dTDP-4-amino-4,6-dideoxygalactose transaminase
MIVPFNDISRENANIKNEIIEALECTIDSGTFILGDRAEQFENEFAKFCGSPFCVGVGSGYDALAVILMSYKRLGLLKDGDEIIVPSNTFIATAFAVTNLNLNLKLVNPCPLTYCLTSKILEDQITPKTKAVILVHLYGYPAISEKFVKVCKDNGLLLIEDAAQAHGAERLGTKVGSYGDAAAFSFYPGKNLGALGDAGAITSHDERLIDCCRKIRNYGSSQKYHHTEIGINSRLDEFQAVILSIKLKSYQQNLMLRSAVAERYFKEINGPDIFLPYNNDLKKTDRTHAFHLFVLRVEARDKFCAFLRSNGIETGIHYPRLIHQHPCYHDVEFCDSEGFADVNQKVVSIPIYPTIRREEVDHVIKVINEFV